MAKLARTRAANEAGNNLPNDLFMLALLYFVFTGTISILDAPLGGGNLKTVSLKLGFKFQSIKETDCGRASSVRLVITTLRGSGLLPGVIQICQSALACPTAAWSQRSSATKSWPAFIADSILSTVAAGVPQRKKSANGSSTPYLSSSRSISLPIVSVNSTVE